MFILSSLQADPQRYYKRSENEQYGEAEAGELNKINDFEKKIVLRKYGRENGNWINWKKKLGERQIEICVNRQRFYFLIIALHSPMLRSLSRVQRGIGSRFGARAGLQLLLNCSIWALDAERLFRLSLSPFMFSYPASSGDNHLQAPAIASRAAQSFRQESRVECAPERCKQSYAIYGAVIPLANLSPTSQGAQWTGRGSVGGGRQGAKCDAKQRNGSDENVCTNSVAKLVFKIRPLLIDLKKYIIAHSVCASERARRRSSRFIRSRSTFLPVGCSLLNDIFASFFFCDFPLLPLFFSGKPALVFRLGPLVWNTSTRHARLIAMHASFYADFYCYYRIWIASVFLQHFCPSPAFICHSLLLFFHFRSQSHFPAQVILAPLFWAGI